MKSLHLNRPNHPLAKQQFTAATLGGYSGTWVVPNNVTEVLISAAQAGAGGGGGNATPGGGGGGGSAGVMVYKLHRTVTPGETLTIVIGQGGAGAPVGASGNLGGVTTVTGSVSGLIIGGRQATGGSPGASPNGGNGGGGLAAGGTGGAGTGGNGSLGISAPVSLIPGTIQVSGGGAGGALSNNGGVGPMATWKFPTLSAPTAATGGTSGGGGGSGGCSIFGQDPRGGAGGNNGAAGSAPADPTAYGAGGGGGSGNAAGGAGNDGFVEIYY